MCGRIVCHSSLAELGYALDASVHPQLAGLYQPSYNIPPSQPLAIAFGSGNQRQLALARWGLLPAWAKDESLSFKTFNARAETVHEKPAFRGAYKYRRCLLPMNGYYEWRRQGKTKLPYYFYRSDGQVLVLAGLFELWRDEVLTCTVITTTANGMAAAVHDRMPVVLEPENWATWLTGSPEELRSLLRPTANETLSNHRVTDQVNRAKNDGVGLIEPLSL
ncbi:MAG: SOS response-associated peptidase [Leptolyngbyaceae bacterium]|nr:SOS response-associated peptidase [Leptolyngbyaceae bacterium]